jgi:hypothetical protein
MSNGLIPSWQHVNEVSVRKDQVIAGHSIGILVLEIWYPLLPGNVANASTYDFPVLFGVVRGATLKQVLTADPSLLSLLVEKGRELEGQGIRAIAGACGYLGNFQKEVAAALNVPVFLSSLLQVPMILRALKREQRVGIICAERDFLTRDVLHACGIDDPSRIVVTDAQGIPEFLNISRSTGHFNSEAIKVGLVDEARKLVNDHAEIGALLLECSDMPPYAWAIQNAIGIPVFDYTTMINWIHTAVVRRPFSGFM